MGWHDWAIVVAGSLLVGWAAFWRGRAIAAEHERDKLLEDRTAHLLKIRELSLSLAQHDAAAHLLPLRLSQERRIREQKR